MLVFFDNNFIDCALKTRGSRQIRQLINFVRKFKLKEFYYFKIEVPLWRFKNFLQNPFKTKIRKGKIYELPRNLIGKDPTIEQEISKKGGIKSHLDGRIYTTKSGYLKHISDAGCHIKDY